MSEDISTTIKNIGDKSNVSTDFLDDNPHLQSNNKIRWKELLRKPTRITNDSETNEDLNPTIYIVLHEINEEVNDNKYESNYFNQSVSLNLNETSKQILNNVSSKMNNENLVSEATDKPANVETKDDSASKMNNKDITDDNNPKIFIDIPEHVVIETRRPDTIEATQESIPEIYIDQPQTSYDIPNSTISLENEDNNINTIFYDPFENRIITPREFSSSPNNSIETNSDSPKPFRPAPPLPYSPVNHNPVQRAVPNDEFDLSPIPINDYPEPPPPYIEFPHMDSSRTDLHHPSPVSVTATARTRVITPASSAVPSSERKQVICQHCGCRVHTLVLRQAGAATHVIAVSFLLFCLLPCALLVYCMDLFKYRNHYCPTCTHLIGFEVPVLCQKLVFVAPKNVQRVNSLATQL